MDGLVKVYREDIDGNEFFMYYVDGGKACAISLICESKQETSEILAKAVADTTPLSIPIFVGEKIGEKIKGEKLKNGFGWFVLVMGFYIIVKEIILNLVINNM